MQIMAYWDQNSPTTNHRSETSLVSEGSLIIQTSSRHAECCLMVIFLYMYDMIYNPRSCSLGTWIRSIYWIPWFYFTIFQWWASCLLHYLRMSVHSSPIFFLALRARGVSLWHVSGSQILKSKSLDWKCSAGRPSRNTCIYCVFINRSQLFAVPAVVESTEVHNRIQTSRWGWNIRNLVSKFEWHIIKL